MPDERKNAIQQSIIAGVGLGLAFASLESMLYRPLWTIGNSTSPLNALVSLVLFVICCLVTVFVFTDARREKTLALPWLIGASVLGTLGLALRLLGAAWERSVLLSLAFSLPEFFSALMIGYGIMLFKTSLGFAIRVLATGTIASGVVQLIVSFVSGEALAYVIVFALAPASIVLFVLFYRAVQGEGFEALLIALTEKPDKPSAIAQNTALLSPTATILALFVIMLASFVIAAAYRQCLGAQSAATFSLVTQVCNGVGTTIAGVLFVVFLKRVTIENFYHCTLLIMPAIVISALYASTLVGGAWAAFSVVMLNAATTTLRIIVFVTPFVTKLHHLRPGLLGLTLILRRCSTLLVTLIFSLLHALQQEGSTVTFVVISALMVLNAVYFMETFKKETPEYSEAARRAACAAVGGAFQLTTREQEVLFFLSKGRTARYVADTLSVSETTIKTHITHIYRKMGINSQQLLIDIVDAELHK